MATTVVAIAGGTSGLGRALSEVLQRQNDIKTIILTRKKNEALEAEIRLPIYSVDYSSVQSIKEVLDEHKVECLISTINYLTEVKPELTLIRAANACNFTKRYIPSIWGSFHYTHEQAKANPAIMPKLKIIEELEQTSLEYMAVYNGYFLDYYGLPHVKSYLANIPIIVDVANGTAAIPGSGEIPVAFTYTFDVAKIVAASLKLPKWPKTAYIIGDKVTGNQLLKLAEEARGMKFEVHHDSLDGLKSGKVTMLPAQKILYDTLPPGQAATLFAGFGVWIENGMLDLDVTKTLNPMLTNIKMLKVKDFLIQVWKDSAKHPAAC